MRRFCTQNCTNKLHKSIAHQFYYCTSILLISDNLLLHCILHTKCAKNNSFFSSFCTVLFFQLHILHAYWSIVQIFAHYCTVLLTIKLINSAAACFFRPLAAACLLWTAALFITLLSMLSLSDLTFKSIIAQIYCKQPSPAGAAAATASLSPPSSSRVVVHGLSRLHMKPFIHYLADVESIDAVIAV